MSDYDTTGLVHRLVIVLLAGGLVTLSVERFADGDSEPLAVVALLVGGTLAILNAPGLVRLIDRPETPTATRPMRVYLIIVVVVTALIGVRIAWIIGATEKSGPLDLLGLMGASASLAVALVFVAASFVQLRRARGPNR